MTIYTTFGQNGPYWVFGNCAIAEDGTLFTCSADRVFTDPHFQPGFQFKLEHPSHDYEPRMPHHMPWTRAQENMAAGMFRSIALQLAGMFGSVGLTALGHACSYAIADHCIDKYAHHPGLWIHGGFCTGKTTLAQLMCFLWGHAPRYTGLRIECVESDEEPAANPTKEPHPPKRTNFRAVERTLGQFTNLPVMLDEYRKPDLSRDLDALLRAACSRARTRPDEWGLQTSPIVVGERVSDDLATAAHYIHVPLYNHVRPKDHMQHYNEMVKIKASLRFIGLALLKNRSLLLAHFQSQMDEWMKDARVLAVMPHDRVRLNYGVTFCALAAAVAVLCKRYELWPDCIPYLNGYREWLIEHVANYERP